MEKSKFHLIGIGGIGMSAIAEWLLQEGYAVTGSDLKISPLTKKLQSLGAKVTEGHLASSITKGTSVVFSSDIPSTNIELQTARQLGCPTLHRSDLARHLIGKKPLLAVTGSHGKTTTTALLTEVLEDGGFAPSFLMGGISLRFLTNGRRGSGDHVVLEADESDGSFLNCSPLGAIVTNVDREHLAYWKTEEALHAAFLTFQRLVINPDLLFTCGDDQVLFNSPYKHTSYGFKPHNDLRVFDLHQNGWNLTFSLSFEGKTYKDIVLHHIGEHQALNAAAVFGLALRLGISEASIRATFLHFKRVKRRLEIKATAPFLFLDDYGHHPTEIATTLKGLKTAFPSKRLVVAFQPHRYSRTLDCLPLFGPAFASADLLIMTEIFAAGESPLPISSQDIVKEIEKHPHPPIHLTARAVLAPFLHSLLQSNDIIISLGAGDITHLYSEFNNLN